jgi:hypothetical protein
VIVPALIRIFGACAPLKIRENLTMPVIVRGTQTLRER